MAKKIERVLVFDVETSGLIPRDRSDVKLEDLPYILQLSYVVFETKGWQVVKCVDTYIDVDPSVEITPQITELTGITRIMCNRGINIDHALREFAYDYMNCDVIVAHNIKFDREMIKIEIERNKHLLADVWLDTFDREFEKQEKKEHFCTMYKSKYLCKIERKNDKGETYYKCPKLVELHEYLFRTTPHSLHNSLVDTFICLRCFVKMRFKFDMSLRYFPDIKFTACEEKT